MIDDGKNFRNGFEISKEGAWCYLVHWQKIYSPESQNRGEGEPAMTLACLLVGIAAAALFALLVTLNSRRLIR